MLPGWREVWDGERQSDQYIRRDDLARMPRLVWRGECMPGVQPIWPRYSNFHPHNACFLFSECESKVASKDCLLGTREPDCNCTSLKFCACTFEYESFVDSKNFVRSPEWTGLQESLLQHHRLCHIHLLWWPTPLPAGGLTSRVFLIVLWWSDEFAAAACRLKTTNYPKRPKTKKKSSNSNPNSKQMYGKFDYIGYLIPSRALYIWIYI